MTPLSFASFDTNAKRDAHPVRDRLILTVNERGQVSPHVVLIDKHLVVIRVELLRDEISLLQLVDGARSP